MKHTLATKQRGVGHVGLILVIVVILVVGGVGWFVWQRNKDDKKPSVESSLQEIINKANCPYEDKELCKFFASYKAQDYYTLTATSENEGQKATTTMQAEGEDKYHVKIEGPLSYEIITIGNSSYTKAANGTWYKQTITPDKAKEYKGEAGVELSEPTTAQSSGTEPAYQRLGKEKCGDQTCFKYQVTDPADPATAQFIWFDDKDYQLRRLQTASGDTTFDATFSYSRVSIKEPSPVKDLGPNQYIIPGQSEPVTLPSAGDGAPSPEELQQLINQYQ